MLLGNDDNLMKRRPIRSFVKREGRMTPGQTRALGELWPIYGLSTSSGEIEFEQVFQRQAPCVLEIGFGMGQSLLEMAIASPEQDFIGVEVHRPGVGSLLAGIGAADINNLRIYSEDVNNVLNQSIKDGSLSKVQVFFPDPWHKKKHHKRRLIQPAFVQLLHQKLQHDGVLHFATDWENYAEHMMEVLSEAPGLVNAVGEGCFINNDGLRPITKFERRGQRLGHGVWDLMFQQSRPQATEIAS